MNFSSFEIWAIIIAISIGTFVFRFSFIGLLGNKKMPNWVLRHLRYTPVAVLPGLVMPLVLWPEAAGKDYDPIRIMVAFFTLAVGVWCKNFPLAALCGGGVFYVLAGTGLT